MREFLTRRGAWLLAAVLLAVAVAGVLAGRDRPTDRAYELEQRLRCPTCQSVSVADSPSDTAAAMRVTVAEQVAAGRSDQEILDYFRARYGFWVLFDPPARGATLLVWVLPVLAVVAAAALLVVAVRRPAPAEPLAEDERARVYAEVRRLAADDGQDEQP